MHGATDEFGFRAVDQPVHVHDLHATMLHLMGFNHERLTYRYAGRDFRLTDVSGEVVRGFSPDRSLLRSPIDRARADIWRAPSRATARPLNGLRAPNAFAVSRAAILRDWSRPTSRG